MDQAQEKLRYLHLLPSIFLTSDFSMKIGEADAISVMMNAQRQLPQRALPDLVERQSSINGRVTTFRLALYKH